jgi:acyl-CoA synthetase (AMP-forming)/AMP-acid ligase II
MSWNVAHHLELQARTDRVAVYQPVGTVKIHGGTPHRSITFTQLNTLTDQYAYGLRQGGVTAGTRVAMMVPPGIEFFAFTFALFKLAAVPVMIDPGMGVKNLGRCLAEAEPAVFIGVSKANIARTLFGWGKASVGLSVNVGSGRCFTKTSSTALAKQPQTPVLAADVLPDQLAAILFTSGSTGLAKGVEYTHGIFTEQVKLLKLVYGIEPGEIDLCTFPLFALFGPALGLSCVVPQMNASRPATINPHKALAQIRQLNVTQMFASPAVLKRISKVAASQAPLNTLRRVISAGAPATLEVLEKVSKLLPDGAQIYTPYGATEALPVANVGSQLLLNQTRMLTEQGHGVCIGKPVPGVTVQIIRIRDDAIAIWDDSLLEPVGTVGEIVVRGPIVTKRYFRRDEATALSKIIDPVSNETIHRMGDVGYFDAEGRLWFCGRKSHRVVLADRTLFTDQVEPVFSSYGSRAALVGVRRSGTIFPVVCIEHHTDAGVKIKRVSWATQQQQLQKCAEQFEHTKSIHTFLLTDCFPMDPRHNSKINREKLAIWADMVLGPNWKGGPS